MDSPVATDSSTVDFPPPTTPSTGTFSPGLTRTWSPTAMSSTGTSSTFPSSVTRRAVSGWRSRRLWTAWEARVRTMRLVYSERDVVGGDEHGDGEEVDGRKAREDEQAEQPTKQACERAGLEEDVLVEDSSAEALERLLRDVAAGPNIVPSASPRVTRSITGEADSKRPITTIIQPISAATTMEAPPARSRRRFPSASSACCCSYRFALSGSRMV